MLFRICDFLLLKNVHINYFNGQECLMHQTFHSVMCRRQYGSAVIFTHGPCQMEHWSSGGLFTHSPFQKSIFSQMEMLAHIWIIKPVRLPGNSRQSNDCYLFLLLFILFPLTFLSGELSTDSRKSSDSYLFLLLILFPLAFLSSELSTYFCSRVG